MLDENGRHTELLYTVALSCLTALLNIRKCNERQEKPREGKRLSIRPWLARRHVSMEQLTWLDLDIKSEPSLVHLNAKSLSTSTCANIAKTFKLSRISFYGKNFEHVQNPTVFYATATVTTKEFILIADAVTHYDNLRSIVTQRNGILILYNNNRRTKA